jgi:protocatechuate 3,4-dioxygenase beta subunit
MDKVNQRLLPLLLLIGLVLVAVFVLGPWHSDAPDSAQADGGETVAEASAVPESSTPEDVGDIPLPDVELDFGVQALERSEFADAALIIDVLLEDGSTAAPTFDLLLLHNEDQVTVLRDRTERVGLADISRIEAVVARDAETWSGGRRISAAEEVDGTLRLQLTLEDPARSFAIATSTTDGQPSAMARMQLRSQSGRASALLASPLVDKEVSASATGGFSAAGLPPERFTADLKLPGYVPVELELDLSEHDLDDMEVVFTPAGGATGRIVFDDTGLAAAQVALLPVDFQDNIFGLALDDFRSFGELPTVIPDHHRAETGADGRFAFHGAAPGEYQLLIAADGYLPQVTRETITIEERRTVAAGDFAVERGFGINLVVVDSKAIPIADVSVNWYRNSGNTLIEARRRRTSEQQSTNRRGMLYLSGLPAELITLELSHPDFAQVVLDHDFSGRGPRSDDPLEVVMRPGATVAGSVVDGRTGMPVAEAELGLHTSENNQAFAALLRGADWSSESGDDGLFHFTHLPPGEYVLIATHEDFADSQVGPFQVTDSAVEDLVVMLHPGATLLVTVLDGEGLPVEGAAVQAVNNEAQKAAGEETDVDGIARFEHLLAGDYQVAFTDISAFDVDSNSGNLDVNFRFITLQDDAVMEIVLGGPVRSADISGVVRRGGELLEQTTVAIITDTGVKTATTDSNGSYMIEGVPLGEFILIVRAGQPLAGGSTFYDNISIVDEGNMNYDIDMPDSGVEISVFAADDHEPLQSIPVSVRPMDASNISGGDFGLTDADGKLRFPGLAPGEYIVAAGNATASFLATSEAGYGSRQQSHVVIREGGGVQKIDMPLEKGASFKVQVRDPEGNLLAGAHMHYLDREGQPLNILSFKGTNSKGVAVMTGLPSGPGIILVRHPLLGSTEIQVDLSAGEESKKAVQLERGTVVYVTTTDADGQPMSGVLAAALDERGAPLSYLWSQEETQATNAAFFGNGEQKLGPLPDGEFMIQLYRPGKPPVKHQLSIHGQREMHLRLPYSAE